MSRLHSSPRRFLFLLFFALQIGDATCDAKQTRRHICVCRGISHCNTEPRHPSGASQSSVLFVRVQSPPRDREKFQQGHSPPAQARLLPLLVTHTRGHLFITARFFFAPPRSVAQPRSPRDSEPPREFPWHTRRGARVHVAVAVAPRPPPASVAPASAGADTRSRYNASSKFLRPLNERLQPARTARASER